MAVSKHIDPNSEIGVSMRFEKEGIELANSMSDAEIDLRDNFPKATDAEIKNLLSKKARNNGS